VVCAGVASIYRGVGDVLFNGGEADVGITSEVRPRSHRDRSDRRQCESEFNSHGPSV
jgi:hypothetical protein